MMTFIQNKKKNKNVNVTKTSEIYFMYYVHFDSIFPYKSKAYQRRLLLKMSNKTKAKSI